MSFISCLSLSRENVGALCLSANIAATTDLKQFKLHSIMHMHTRYTSRNTSYTSRARWMLALCCIDIHHVDMARPWSQKMISWSALLHTERTKATASVTIASSDNSLGVHTPHAVWGHQCYHHPACRSMRPLMIRHPAPAGFMMIALQTKPGPMHTLMRSQRCQCTLWCLETKLPEQRIDKLH